MTLTDARKLRDEKAPITLTRILCPYLWDHGPVPCREDEERRCVVAACGDVARTVPLVIRYHAGIPYAEDRAKWLKMLLEGWGYVKVEIIRGLGR